MFISVIIPTCNRSDLLNECLNLLRSEYQNTCNLTYEIIVTDDGTENSSKEMIETKYPLTKWVKGPRKGPAANRNNGASFSTGDWLIFIDDDCLPDKNILEEYYQSCLTNKGVLVYEGCTRAERAQRSFIEEAPLNENGGYLWSCNFMIEKKLFFQIGGFDTGFPYAAVEDVEFHYRLQKQSEKIVFVKNAFVIHPWRIQKKVFSVTLKRFDSILYFLKKHPEKANQLNAEYYMKIVLVRIKSLFTKSFQYNFRGVTGNIIFSALHFYFALYFLFKKNNQAKNNL